MNLPTSIDLSKIRLISEMELVGDEWVEWYVTDFEDYFYDCIEEYYMQEDDWWGDV